MSEPRGAASVPVVVDCDTGIDDALALLALARLPEVELAAVGTVHGNVPAPTGARNTLRVLEVAGLTAVPVAVGARKPLAQRLNTSEAVHGRDGLGETDQPAPKGTVVDGSAAEQLVDLARSRPGELSLLAVGPLTNVGLAVMIEPALPTLLRQLVVMGGAFDVPGNITPRAEANIWHDPEAAAIVFEAFGPVPATPGTDPAPARAVGLDVTHEALMRPEHLARISAADTDVSRFAWQILQFYLDFYERRMGRRVCSVHDGVAAALLLHPAWATWATRRVEVELRNLRTRGATLVDRRRDQDPGGAVVSVAAEVDRDAVVSLLVDALVS